MTTKQMAQMSDFAFAAMILQDKLDRLENPNTPLANRLQLAIHGLKRNDIYDKTRPKSWWNIEFVGEAGQPISPADVPDLELLRIGGLVARGYWQGQIDFDADESEEYES